MMTKTHRTGTFCTTRSWSNVEKISSSELLEGIFCNLTIKDLKNVRLVCKLWREVSFLPSLNTNIVVQMNYPDEREVSNITTSGFRISDLKLNLAEPRQSFNLVPFPASYGSSLKSLKVSSSLQLEDSNLVFNVECCPNLDTLHLRRCNLADLKLNQDTMKLNLKELRLASTNLTGVDITSLVALLAPGMTKFVYLPHDEQNLSTNQLKNIFELVTKTLSEVEIAWLLSWGEPDSKIIDFDAIFGVSGLRLKKVTLASDSCFNEMISALVCYHSDWLEEVHVIDYSCDVDFQFQRCISLGFRRLRKFKCVGRLTDFTKERVLSLLRDAECHSELREIEVTNLISLTRKNASETFEPNMFTAKFDELSFIESQSDAVWRVLHNKSLLLLTILVLEHVDLSQHGMAFIIFANCVNLIELRLQVCNLHDPLLMNGVVGNLQIPELQWDSILEGKMFPIMSLTQLKVLDLSFNFHLTSFSVTRVIKLPNLKTLRLDRIYLLCDHRLVQLAHNNPSLVEVSFNRIDLTDNAIVEFVRNVPNLEVLEIESNYELTDYALREISKHKKLKRVAVSGCADISHECIDFVLAKKRGPIFEKKW